jgi:Uma2 family endonuclease
MGKFSIATGATILTAGHTPRVIFVLAALGNGLGAFVFPSLKLRVKPDRYRVVDVCLFLEEPTAQIPDVPPFLCIEIVSPEDGFRRMGERVDDYLVMGGAPLVPKPCLRMRSQCIPIGSRRD